MTRPWPKSFSGPGVELGEFANQEVFVPWVAQGLLGSHHLQGSEQPGPLCWPILFPSLCGAQGGPWAGRQPGRPLSISTFVDPTSDGGVVPVPTETLL